MSWDYYHTSTPIAKKDYDCDAWPWIDNGDVINQGILSVSDYREIIKAGKNGYKIKKGQRYNKIEGKFDGEFCTFRAIPALDAICHAHKLYRDC